MEKEKPVVQIKEAKVGPHWWGRSTQILYGLPVDHPREYLNNNERFHSSPVIKVDGDTVETENTIYKVLSWYKD